MVVSRTEAVGKEETTQSSRPGWDQLESFVGVMGYMIIAY